MKESREEISKLQLKKFILDNLNYNYTNVGNNNNKISNTQRNKSIKDKNGFLNNVFNEKGKSKFTQIKDINIYYYEMNFIDINKLGNEMGKQIINLLIII